MLSFDSPKIAKSYITYSFRGGEATLEARFTQCQVAPPARKKYKNGSLNLFATYFLPSIK